MAHSPDRPEEPSVSARGRAELLAAAFHGLDRVGVRWALLRGRADLGDPGGDVDLLVRADDLDSFEDVAFELGAFVLPRLRVPGSWSRAVLRHPWHRFYVLSDPSSGASVKLDVVTQLVYNKQLRLASDLERGCLDRRVVDDGVYVLDPSDTFWTVLLHCLLDKQKITPHRAAELESVLGEVRRPSPGEEYFEALCPSDCSADQAISLVRNRDWRALADLGRRIVAPHAESEAGATGTTGTTADSESRPGGRPRARRGGRSVLRLHQALRTAAVSIYPVVWRRAGLGTVPRVLDLMEAGSFEATVLVLRRRPGVCDVVVLLSEEQRASAGAALRAGHYVPAAGGWFRLTGAGLERVRLVTAQQLAVSEDSVHRLRASSLPMAGRTHCRRAVGPDRLLDGV